MVYAVIFLVAYLLGSIPFGLLVAHVGYRIDLRKHGSGNIGATNALRTLGPSGGGSVLALDMGKGILAAFSSLLVYSAFSHGGIDWSWVWSALGSPVAIPEAVIPGSVALVGVVIGHLFPVWLGFKGGKGVACGAGALLLVFGWLPGLIEVSVFVGVVAKWRYVSLGSICCAALCPVIALVVFWGNPVGIVLCFAAAALVIWAHRENISRLKAGTERKLGQK